MLSPTTTLSPDLKPGTYLAEMTSGVHNPEADGRVARDWTKRKIFHIGRYYVVSVEAEEAPEHVIAAWRENLDDEQVAQLTKEWDRRKVTISCLLDKYTTHSFVTYIRDEKWSARYLFDEETEKPTAVARLIESLTLVEPTNSEWLEMRMREEVDRDRAGYLLLEGFLRHGVVSRRDIELMSKLLEAEYDREEAEANLDSALGGL